MVLFRSNAKNDAELHRLLHTGLLSAAVNTEVASSAAQRKKALEGRVLELANRSKLGRGEKDVRVAEHKKAAKHIRIGIKEKQKKRDAKGLEDVSPVLILFNFIWRLNLVSFHSRRRTPAITILR